MAQQMGLRERKKLEQRERLADLAAALFAERGYDEVSMSDVARAADVSEQTVYNYFPTKPDLVLDRAEEIRERYGRVVHERGTASPASVLSELVREDIDRFRRIDLGLARGEFPALSVSSGVLHRFALEFRAGQIETVAAAIVDTTSGIDPLVAYAHAAALVSIVHVITERIGTSVLHGDAPESVAEAMERDARAAFDDLHRHFSTITGTPEPDHPTP